MSKKLAFWMIMMVLSICFASKTAMAGVGLSDKEEDYLGKIIECDGASTYVIYSTFVLEDPAEPASDCSDDAKHIFLAYDPIGKPYSLQGVRCEEVGDGCVFRCFVPLRALDGMLQHVPESQYAQVEFALADQTKGLTNRDAWGADLLLLMEDPNSHVPTSPWYETVGPWTDADGDNIPESVAGEPLDSSVDACHQDVLSKVPQIPAGDRSGIFFPLPPGDADGGASEPSPPETEAESESTPPSTLDGVDALTDDTTISPDDAALRGFDVGPACAMIQATVAHPFGALLLLAPLLSFLWQRRARQPRP
jgi:hypothetical protein